MISTFKDLGRTTKLCIGHFLRMKYFHLSQVSPVQYQDHLIRSLRTMQQLMNNSKSNSSKKKKQKSRKSKRNVKWCFKHSQLKKRLR